MSSPAGAVFQNILLRPGAAGRVTLTFRKLRTTPRGRFIIDAIQTSRNERPEGGVTYEIHTDRSSRR